MNKHFALAMALAATVASGALAQDITSTSGSSSGANSGSASQSGAASNQAQQQAVDVRNGASESNSTSGANANSSTASNSAASSNDVIGLNSSNTASNTATNTANQNASQANGQSANMAVNTTFNSYQRKTQEVRTNAAVPLTASSSFSSDFCGSTQSGGASASPIGISLGVAGTKYDQTCRSLRVAEKAGMLAVSANNMGFKDLSARLTALATWSVCTANGEASIAACKTLALVGLDAASPVPKTETEAAASMIVATEPDRLAVQSTGVPVAATPAADKALAAQH